MGEHHGGETEERPAVMPGVDTVIERDQVQVRFLQPDGQIEDLPMVPPEAVQCGDVENAAGRKRRYRAVQRWPKDRGPAAKVLMDLADAGGDQPLALGDKSGAAAKRAGIADHG